MKRRATSGIIWHCHSEWNLPSNIGNRNISGTRSTTGHCSWQTTWVKFGHWRFGHGCNLEAQFSDSEMGPNEENLKAHMLTSSLAQVYSIAKWNPPPIPWPIPEPIYNQKGATLFMPPTKPHHNPIIFYRKEGPHLQFMLNPLSIRGALNSTDITLC